MAAINDIALRRGEDVTLHFTMVPVQDISTWQIKFFSERRHPNDVVEVTAAIVDGPGGVFEVVLPSALTRTFHKGRFYYDVWRLGTGEDAVLSAGNFDVIGVERLLT